MKNTSKIFSIIFKKLSWEKSAVFPEISYPEIKLGKSYPYLLVSD